MLRELIRSPTVRNAIIFCNRKVEVAILHRSLVKHGFNAGALHGDMDQKSRMETLDKFRSGELMLLAASDVAARGLDIPDVSHIFNFDLPWQPDDYVHRIGRTGRAGKEGVSTSLVTPDELKSLKDIEKMLGVPVEWIGEGPSEQDYADAGKRKRRGGRGAPARGRGPAAGRPQEKGRSRERPDSARASARRRGRRGRRAARASVRRRRRARNVTSGRSVASTPGTRCVTPSRDRSGLSAGRSKAGSNLESSGASRGPSTGASRDRNSGPSRGQERRPDHRAEQPRGPASGEPRGGKPQGQPKPQQERGRERQPQQAAQRQGFADNVPAFLRNPVKRPAKVAGE